MRALSLPVERVIGVVGGSRDQDDLVGFGMAKTEMTKASGLTDFIVVPGPCYTQCHNG